jgi:hypothetical protein
MGACKFRVGTLLRLMASGVDLQQLLMLSDVGAFGIRDASLQMHFGFVDLIDCSLLSEPINPNHSINQ